MTFYLRPADVPRRDNDRCIVSWCYLRTLTANLNCNYGFNYTPDLILTSNYGSPL